MLQQLYDCLCQSPSQFTEKNSSASFTGEGRHPAAADADRAVSSSPTFAAPAVSGTNGMTEEQALLVLSYLNTAIVLLENLSSYGKASPEALALLEVALRPQLLVASPAQLATIAAQFAMAGHSLHQSNVSAIATRASALLRNDDPSAQAAASFSSRQTTDDGAEASSQAAYPHKPLISNSNQLEPGNQPPYAATDDALRAGMLQAEQLMSELIPSENEDEAPNTQALGGFTIQTLATLSWALAAMGYSGGGAAEVLQPLCTAALAAPNDQVQQISAPKMLWTFARLQFKPTDDVLTLFAYNLKAQAEELTAEDACDTISALAGLNYKPAALLPVLEKVLASRVQQLTPAQLSTSARSFATMQHDPGLLLSAIAEASSSKIQVRDHC